MKEVQEMYDYRVNEVYFYFTLISVSCFGLYLALGSSDFWWCASELHWGRVGIVGSIPEESLQKCDVGDLPEPQSSR